MTASNDKARTREPLRKDDRKQPEGQVAHIINKGLPPGIEPEDAEDPGAQTPKKPVDNRS